MDLMFCKGVTNAGLKDLAALKRIKTLSVGGTQATPDAVNELRKVMTECKVFN